MEKKIGRIENGINLDHLQLGSAWYIIKLLKLDNIKHPVGIGLNLGSKKMGKKDLIKIENYRLSPQELELISVFARGAMYSVIENYQVISKTQIQLPSEVNNLIICPNHRCISHQHKSRFHMEPKGNELIARCHYCENGYQLESLSEFNIE